jgi:hypothetical protein
MVLKRKIGRAMPNTPKAHGFRLARCRKPGCGPHLVAFDKDGIDICDVAIPMKTASSFVSALQAFLYEHAVEGDQ